MRRVLHIAVCSVAGRGTRSLLQAGMVWLWGWGHSHSSSSSCWVHLLTQTTTENLILEFFQNYDLCELRIYVESFVWWICYIDARDVDEGRALLLQPSTSLFPRVFPALVRVLRLPVPLSFFFFVRFDLPAVQFVDPALLIPLLDIRWNGIGLHLNQNCEIQDSKKACTSIC